MKTFAVTKKRLCATGLMATLNEHDGAFRFDSSNGKMNNSFGYIEKGSVVFTSSYGEVKADEGDLIFVPEGIKYCSSWTGDEIKFYSVHFRTDITDSPYWHSLDIQKIDGISGIEAGAQIKDIFRLCKGDFSEQFRAYSIFYALCAEVEPHLKKRYTEELPETLRTAIKYIENNCAEINSVKEISSACFISESRLYHLFKEYMNTSPVSYINRIKILHAVEMIQQTDLPLQEIAYRLNYHSEYYFRKTFRQITGTNPSAFKKSRK